MMQHWIHEPSDMGLVFGDFHASYFMFPFECYPGVEVVIRGQYPHARYMSFTVSGDGDILIASAHDQELVPDPGSQNPFENGGDWEAAKRSYTLIISPDAAPGVKNFIPGPGCNTIYAGSFPDGKPNKAAIITYRIYAPGIGYDHFGNAGLPVISYRSAQNSAATQSDHPSFEEGRQQQPPETAAVDASFVDENDKYRKSDIHWSTPNTFQATLLQFNPNTVYLISSELNRDPGKLLYLHWKAPKVPDTWQNIGITGKEDMRYWSMSFFAVHGAFGLKTVSDYETVVDQHGYVNLVIGFGAQRPVFVTPAAGFTWVDLSELPFVPISVIYRNILISPSFKYTAQGIPVNTAVPPWKLGDYYPSGNYINLNNGA